ncbi:MAG: PAS domain S-box protein [Methanospirillum sp.]
MAPPPRVLLVDDDPDLLAIGKIYLERAGPFMIETGSSAPAALDLLTREPFDAVVSDYQMPEMDGIELLGLIRERHGRLPFILFTGRGREEVVIQAIDEGADFYVQKGGDPKAQFAELAHKTRVAIERRATERAFVERERRFRALIRNSSDIIRIIDRDGLIAYDSDSGPRILGYAPGSVLGISPLEFVHPEDRETVRKALEAVYARTNPGTPTGYRVRHADGSWVAVEGVATNLIGTPGVDGIVTTAWPVEARRRAEEALLLSERRFRRAEEIAGIGHWELHLKTGIIHMSRGAQALYGLHGDEHTLTAVQDASLPEYRPALDRALRELVEEGRPYEVEFAIRRPDDGRRRELRLVAMYDPERRTVFGILQDITERRQADDALRAGEERYRTLAEDMPVYFCTFLPDDTVTYVNTALATMIGEAPEAIVGRSVFEMIPSADTALVRTALAGLTPERPVETHEQSLLAPDGTPRVQQWTNRGYFDADGRLIRLQAVGLDITELREAEAALRRANRTLTLLTGITRHDIDNQLAVLRGYLSLARMEEEGTAVAAFLDRSMVAAERIAAMIRFTATWDGIGSQPPVWLDARSTVDAAAQDAAPSELHVANDLPEGLHFWGGPLVTRVVAGLIENSVRHGVSATMVRFSAEEREEGRLAIVCEDDGVGVPADEKEQIFERGYGSNTGLGLFLAREALGLTGISITETGSTGTGARFELAVPRGGWRYVGGDGSP